MPPSGSAVRVLSRALKLLQSHGVVFTKPASVDGVTRTRRSGGRCGGQVSGRRYTASDPRSGLGCGSAATPVWMARTALGSGCLWRVNQDENSCCLI